MSTLSLEERRTRLIAYLEVKLAERDWHGVSDAANDLRELEVAIAIGAKAAGLWEVPPGKDPWVCPYCHAVDLPGAPGFLNGMHLCPGAKKP